MTTVQHIATSRPHGKTFRVARGFTLLELLIAAALSSVLLGVVWHTLATHIRLYEKRGESTTRTQLARAVRYQFLSDIDHLIRTPSAAARDSTTRDSTTRDSTTRDSTTRDTATASLAYGLRGDRHSLEIAILEPVWRPLDGVSPEQTDRAENGQPKQTQLTSPIRLIRYQFVGAPHTKDVLPGSLSQVVVDAIQQEPESGQPTGFSGEEDVLDDAFSAGDISPTNASVPGLLREVHAEPPLPPDHEPAQHRITETFPLDSRPPLAAATEATLADMPAASPVSAANMIVDHVPEIERLEFRYFDGQRWHGHWDSSVSGNLPAAVEMSFEFAQSRPSVRPQRSTRHPTRGGSKDASSPLQPAVTLTPSPTFDSPPQDTGTVFRSLAVLRAPPRPAPPSAAIEEYP